jgi:hypothetical protein
MTPQHTNPDMPRTTDAEPEVLAQMYAYFDAMPLPPWTEPDYDWSPEDPRPAPLKRSL